VNLSSGGLAILVVGVLWFLVLLPSFIKGETGEKREYKEDSIRRSEQPKQTRSEVAVTETPDQAVVDSNSFKPSEVPNQAYLKTGAIEIVELADVVSIDKEKTEIDSIDEILRRRRHVG
jgi:hypothetical protein